MADFDEQSIDIRYFTDLWGPFLFNFPACTSAIANDGVIPYSASIATVSVCAYIGNVKPLSNLSGFTDITSDIIDPAYTPVVQDSVNISVKFQYPGDTYKGEKVTVIFQLSLDTGATHPFYFQYLKVR